MTKEQIQTLAEYADSFHTKDVILCDYYTQ